MDPSRLRRPEAQPKPRPPRPTRARDTVEIPRAWLAVLSGGLLVALLVVAYLIGRESGRRATATVDTAAEVSVGHRPPASTGGDEAPPAPPSRVEATPKIGRPLALEGWTEPAPESAGDPQEAAVAAYFAEIEGYEQQAKYWSNPQELAMSVLGQGAQGDTSGMQQLLETQRTAQRQIESMTVPPPCQEHHRRTLAVLDRALQLLTGIEGGLGSGDIEGLLALGGEARQLEAETREIDALAAQVKSRFGLAGLVSGGAAGP